MSRNKSKHRKKKKLPSEKQPDGKQQKHEGGVHISGTVEVRSLDSFIRQRTTERQEDSAEHATERKQDGGRESHKILREWLTFVAVAGYAFVAAWQGCLMKETVQTTRDNFVKEQRAWISVPLPNSFPMDGPTIPIRLQLVDTGKTVAKKVNGSFIATTLNKGDKLPFDWFHDGHAYSKLYAGAVFPTANPPLETVITVVKYGPREPETVIVTPELRDRVLRSDESFIVLLGKIIYCDVFHVSHWTTFCTGSGKGIELSGVQDCMGYNDVDTNTTPSLTDCP
jgi:hypothetical protein